MTNIKTRNHKSYILPAMLLCAFIALLIAGALSVRTTQAVLTDSAQPVDNVFSIERKHTLEYDANVIGSSIKVPDMQTEYGDGEVEFTISNEKPVRPGFAFKGWSLKRSPEDTDTIYNGNDKYKTEEKHTVMYAQWETGYTLIYDANRGKDKNGEDYTGKAAPAAESVASTSPEYTFNIAEPGAMSFEIELNGAKTDEYKVFLGWSEDPDAKVPTYTANGELAYQGDDYDGTKPTNLEKTITIDINETPSRSKTLYAVWATKYELDYQYHPDMLAMDDPKCGTVLPDKQTFVSMKEEHAFKIPEESDANRPTRTKGYTWGWWGDNLERFGYVETLPTSAPVNEGCYLFDEQIKPLKKDAPMQTLYAYFQPPRDATVLFDSNTSWMPTRNNIHYTAYDKDGTVYPMPNPCYGYTNEHEYIPWEDGVPTTIPKHSVEYNGNTYSDRYVFKGWAYTPDAKEPDVLPGQKDFSINMVLSNKVTLYAVWESGHNYRLLFDYNASSSSYRRVYYKKAEKQADDTWKYEWTINENNSGDNRVWFSSDDWADKDVYRTTALEYFAERSHTWSKDFFKDRGVFATRSDDSFGTYKFLGWSYERQDASVHPETLTVDFPVEIPSPADKENPNPLYPDKSELTGTVGCITKDVTFNEPNDTCTTPTTHPVTLYAVWQRSPKHQLALSFNKGGASNDLSYSYKDYYDPSSSGYVASVDLTQRTWTADELSRLTVPTKNDDDTATYEFIGWTNKDTTELPDGIGTEEDVVIHVGQDGKINEPVTVKEPKDNPRECDGGRHTDTYYPVFKKTARHTFEVNFDLNAPSSADTVETHLYKSDDGSTWTKDKVKIGKFAKDNTAKSPTGQLDKKSQALTEPNYTYPLNGKGWFATCVNTSPNSTSNYTFLGWSTEQYDVGEYDANNPEHHLDFPVTVPVDPDNPGSGEGTLSKDLKILEEEEDPQCSIEENRGETHKRTLYGVWAGEKLHQFAVVFVANADDAPNQKIVHGSNQNWIDGGNALAKDGETIPKDTEDFKGTDLDSNGDGKLDSALPNTWRTYSDALRMPKDTSDPEYSKSYTFGSDYWNDQTANPAKDLIVKAEAGDSDGMHYEFKGWATTKDADEPNISVDGNGYITTPLTINSDEYPCDSKTHHTVLYGVWEKTKLHNYQLIFYANGGNSLTTESPGTYAYSLRKSDIVGLMNPDSVPNTMYYTGRFTSAKDVAKTYNSHTWVAGADDKIKATATHANTTESGVKYKWIFKGWSEDPQATTAQYQVNSEGYLTTDVRIDSPHSGTDDCSANTHSKVLFAVWEKEVIPPEPAKHRFALSFNLNGGTSKFRKFNSTDNTWEDASTPTIYEPASHELSSIRTYYTWPVNILTQNGFGGARRDSDTWYNYEFMGWSTTQVSPSENPDMSSAIAWSHDPNSENPGDGFITANNLTSECRGTDKEDSETTHTLTLYAIWKRTPRTKLYTLKFDGNSSTAQGIPNDVENQPEIYDGTNKWNKHTFDLSDTADPTNQSFVFAGWSEDKNSSSGQYGNPYLGDDDEDRKEMTKHLSPDFTTEPALANNVYESEKTLYAIWLYEYKLEYDSNGDEAMNAPPHMHAYDKAAQKTTRLRDAVPSWEGHKFLGWSTDKNATTATYQPNQQITMHDNGNLDDDNRVGRAHIKLYAVWGPAD